MKSRRHHNSKWLAWLLSIAVAMTILPAQASWQCLDGHLCPPDCAMQRAKEDTKASEAPMQCLLAKKTNSASGDHCSLCATAQPSHSQSKELCTSPICVLRIQLTPDTITTVPLQHVFDVDNVVVLAPAASHLIVAEATSPLSFGSLRAPPGSVVSRLHSSRAPPALP